MDMEPGLYAQVVMIRQKYLDHKKDKEIIKKYKSQGQSAKSIRWFDIDHKWLEKSITQGFFLKNNLSKIY